MSIQHQRQPSRPQYWRELSNALRLAWGQRSSFLLAIAGSVTFAAATVATGWSVGWLVDSLVTPTFDSDASTEPIGLGFAVGVFVAIGAARSIGVVIRRYFAGKTGAGAELGWRRRLSSVLTQRSQTWIDIQSSGTLLSASGSDIQVACDPLHPLPLAVGAVAMVVLAVGALVVTDVTLGLIVLVLVIVTAATNAIVSRQINHLSGEVQDKLGTVTEVAHESFHGALLVKTLGLERLEAKRLATATDELRHRRVRLSSAFAYMDAVFSGLPILGLLLLIVVGASQAAAGRASAGDVVFAVALFMQLGFPLGVVGFFFESSGRAMAASARLHATLDSEDLDGSATGPPAHATGAGARVELRDVTFRYPMSLNDMQRSLELGATATRTTALAGLNLQVEPGEVVALVGPTGSGKSSICRLICGLYKADEGTVVLDGVDLATVAVTDRPTGTALAFQEPFLFASDIISNIDLSGHQDRAALRDAARSAAIDDVIEALPEGYNAVLGERGVTLSGGQRQRVALARALAAKPRLLVLDDATSAVDPVIESSILSQLETDRSTTVVIVAQRRSSIERADRVAFIVDGAVAATGTHRELLHHAAYRDLVSAYAESEA